MPRLSQDAIVATAVTVSFMSMGGAGIELGVQADRLAFGTTPEEHNAQVEACAGQLGERAVRTMNMPNACQPFKTGFAFHGKWVTVRMPTHVNNSLPAYDSWQRKVFDLPSGEAFRQAKLEPVDDEPRNRTAVAALGGVLSGFALLFSAGGLSTVLSETMRRRKAGIE